MHPRQVADLVPLYNYFYFFIVNVIYVVMLTNFYNNIDINNLYWLNLYINNIVILLIYYEESIIYNFNFNLYQGDLNHNFY